MILHAPPTSKAFINLSIADAAQSDPQQVFYQEEELLANELATTLPDNLPRQPLSEISPDEFEQLYTWFLS
jgi:hypothetical protein